jgi:hypothetical protein
MDVLTPHMDVTVRRVASSLFERLRAKPTSQPHPLELDVAINEADWLELELDPDRREARIRLRVLTLPRGNGGTGSAEVLLQLRNVRRIVASLRPGRGNDDVAAECFSLDALPDVVASFGGKPVHGWEFFDVADGYWTRRPERLSVDESWLPEPAPHSLRLFQETFGTAPPRHLDVRFTFDELQVLDGIGNALDLEEFAAGGRRWWKAMRAGDERTTASGIVVPT